MSIITTEFSGMKTESFPAFYPKMKVLKRRDSLSLEDQKLVAELDERFRESEGHWISHEAAKARLGL